MNIMFLLQPKKDVRYLSDTDNMNDGITKLRQSGFSAIPVIEKTNGTYLGSVSEGDFLGYMLDNNLFTPESREEVTVMDVLNPDKYQSVGVTAHMDALLLLGISQNFVPVVDGRNCFAGIITRRDIMKYYYYKNTE